MTPPNSLAPPNPYLADLVMSASPTQLVTLLHDGLIRFLGAAHDGFSEGNPQKRCEKISNNLIRAQSILTELDASLDMEHGGEIARQLHALYLFFMDTLQRVNTTKQPETILRIISMLTELRDAWSEVAINPAGTGNGSQPKVTSARQITLTPA